MLHYLRYLRALLSMSFGSVMIYRVDFVLRIVRSVIEVGLGWITIEALFLNVPAVAGWSKEGVLLVYALALTIVAAVMFLCGSGLESFHRKIREGTLDYDLVKPMDTQWLASVWVLYVTNFFRIVFSAGTFAFVLMRLDQPIGLWQWILFGLATVASGIVYYCLIFMGSLVSFWSLSPELYYLFNSIVSVIRYPIDLYPTVTRLLLSIFPLILITTVPVKILLGDISWMSFGALPIALLLFFITRQFWKLGLRSYQSASS